MDISAFVSSLWLHPAFLLAGFAGGVCYAFLLDAPNPKNVMGAVIMGMLTANYSSALVEKALGQAGEGTGLGLAAFITGLCATPICKRLIKRARKGASNGSEGIS